MHAVIESAWLSSNFPGQRECGDRHLVESTPNGALIAVTDGLGHGDKAAEASEKAIEEVKRAAESDTPVVDIVRQCDAALRNTRGVAMALSAIDRQTETLTWLGIGNVEGRLLSPTGDGTYSRQTLLMRSGVVGYSLPELRPDTTQLRRGDLLILATDGIRPDFAASIPLNQPIQEICSFIMTRYTREDDDALLVAVRYLG